MGPSKTFADEQAEEAFEEIMALLKEKYGVSNWSFPEPERLDDNIATAMYAITNRNAQEWDEKANELKKALVDLIWHQHCMDF